MESSEFLATVADMHGEARRRALFFQNSTDETLVGRELHLNGAELLSFSSCSYLGLEHHPELVRGVQDAVARYGTQFSSSRGYVSAPGYRELESLLSELFGGFALVTPTTTLGHQIALPVLATEKDAIVLDHQVHHSVHMAATLARAGGTRVEIVRHSDLERAVALVADLARRARTVWFACDGVFSMYGDLAPLALLRALLDVAPNVRLYVDDAHGMSWAGEHGRGSFLSRMPLGPRIVVATSLNKAFSAAGGCIVFPTEAERERVRICGGPMVFSGPIQPPMLGAALASARVHLSSEITTRQAVLRARVDLCNRLLREAELPLLVENESPIFFVRLGLPRVAFAVAERLIAEGLYVNVSMYPAVPMKRAGIRLALTSAHTLDDVARVVESLARNVPAALDAEGLSRAQLDELFVHAVPDEARTSEAYESTAALATRLMITPGAHANDGAAAHADRGARVRTWPSTGTHAVVRVAALDVEHVRTIHAIDRATWDAAMGGVAACSWDAMATCERLFVQQPRPEHNWQFHYVIVRDRATGRPACVTYFTEALNKDDMLMRDEVSRAVEARRADDPYFLTSKVVMTGSLMSEGNHVWLDRAGPWREALLAAVKVGQDVYEACGANTFVLRDLPGDDREMDSVLLDTGFVKVPMLDSHRLDVGFADDAGLAATLTKRKRAHLREQVANAGAFEIAFHGARTADAGPLDAATQATMLAMYRAVAERKRRLNVFELPPDFIAALLDSPAWELGVLRLRADAEGPPDGRPVAWYAAHVHGEDYAPFVCGLDYEYVMKRGGYRQMLLQIVRRARDLGSKRIHLGMDADYEKSRFGARSVQTCAYVQASDHFNGALLREIVAEVGIAGGSK